ncbi:YqhR family membrane protein [Terribacillus halophilus]|uniref:YqhR family membrane protein n=1 Tax=Terribacillus halophilus TaxID=361279 RepID=UPI00098650DD|nr:YqhR family membrane protein [Terribacillus halophilus]
MQQNRKAASRFNLSDIITGFIGGVLWATVAWLAYFFHFTDLSVADFILRSWVWMPWADSWAGELVSILLVGILSVLVAFLYYVFLKKSQGIIPSLLFGVALWVLVQIILAPIIYGVDSAFQADRNANITTMCLYLLYAVFIGYSISYEYQQSQAYQDNT